MSDLSPIEVRNVQWNGLQDRVDIMLFGAEGPTMEHAEVRRAARELEEAHAADPIVDYFVSWVQVAVERWAAGLLLYRKEYRWRQGTNTPSSPARVARVARSLGVMMEGGHDDLAREMCLCEQEYTEAAAEHAHRVRPKSRVYTQEQFD